MRHSVLIIEDDPSVAELVRLHLEQEGYLVEWADRGDIGLRTAQEGAFDLIILDVNLPQLNGFEVLSRLREENRKVQVILLTTRDHEIEKVKGLSLGADDYLVKPFSIHELLARIHARLRRLGSEHQSADEPQVMVLGELQLDPLKRLVLRNSVPLELTAKEFDLLFFLAQHPGRPLTREQILQEVWGISCEGYERNVSTLITRLRKKVEPDPEDPVYIISVRGIGYRFAEAHEVNRKSPESV